MGSLADPIKTAELSSRDQRRGIFGIRAGVVEYPKGRRLRSKPAKLVQRPPPACANLRRRNVVTAARYPCGYALDRDLRRRKEDVDQADESSRAPDLGDQRSILVGAEDRFNSNGAAGV